MIGRKKKPCRKGCPWPLMIAGSQRARCGLCGSIFTLDRATSQWSPVHPGARVA